MEPVMLWAAVAVVLQVANEHLIPALIGEGIPIPPLVTGIVNAAIVLVAAFRARSLVTPTAKLPSNTTGTAWLLPLVLCGALTSGCMPKTQLQTVGILDEASQALGTVQRGAIAAYCRDGQTVPCPEGQRVVKEDGSVYVTDDQHVSAQRDIREAAVALSLANDALEQAQFASAKDQIRIAVAAVRQAVETLSVGGLTEELRLSISIAMTTATSIMETVLRALPDDTEARQIQRDIDAVVTALAD